MKIYLLKILTTSLHIPRPVAHQGLLIEHQTEGTTELVGREGRNSIPGVVQTGEEPATVLRVGIVAGLGGALEPVARHRGDFTRT